MHHLPIVGSMSSCTFTTEAKLCTQWCICPGWQYLVRSLQPLGALVYSSHYDHLNAAYSFIWTECRNDTEHVVVCMSWFIKWKVCNSLARWYHVPGHRTHTPSFPSNIAPVSPTETDVTLYASCFPSTSIIIIRMDTSCWYQWHFLESRCSRCNHAN